MIATTIQGVVPAVVKSSMLDLKDYITLSWIIRMPPNWYFQKYCFLFFLLTDMKTFFKYRIEFLRYFHPPSDGEERLRFWSKSLKSTIRSEVFLMRKAATTTTPKEMDSDLYQQ
jgi:hypothetical protein